MYTYEKTKLALGAFNVKSPSGKIIATATEETDAIRIVESLNSDTIKPIKAEEGQLVFVDPVIALAEKILVASMSNKEATQKNIDKAMLMAEQFYETVDNRNNKMAAMRKIVEAVAHIGVDFGHGEYHIQDWQIQKARELLKDDNA